MHGLIFSFNEERRPIKCIKKLALEIFKLVKVRKMIRISEIHEEMKKIYLWHKEKDSVVRRIYDVLNVFKGLGMIYSVKNGFLIFRSQKIRELFLKLQ